jgi:DNA-binding transcriptional MocR family regulator
VVIRVNSFSKMLAPGLRLGWINAARPIVDQLVMMKQQIDPHTQNLVQLVVARLIETSAFDRHLDVLRTEHRRRRDALVKAMQQHVPESAIRFNVPEGGLFLWCRLGQGLNAKSVQQRALADSVFFVTGEPFYADGGGSHEIRLCFSARSPEVVAKAARVLAASVDAVAEQAPVYERAARLV